MTRFSKGCAPRCASADPMRVLVGADEHAVARAAAALIAARRPHVLGVATGSSPVLTYHELVRAHSLPADVQLCLLDEYVGLAPDDPRRYRAVIVDQLASPLGLADDQIHAPDVDSDDLDLAADHYEQLLRDLGGVDVQILGIGRNGHIGFNEPGTAAESRTHVGFLHDATRLDNARFFAGIECVPHKVVTQGPATIADARSIVLIATGAAKNAAMAAFIARRKSRLVPASCLFDHPDLTVIGDHAALDGATYPRTLLEPL